MATVSVISMSVVRIVWIDADQSDRSDRHDGHARPEGPSTADLVLHARDDVERTSPCRMMTMPDTTSPVPSRSAAPRRRSGPSTTSPMSLTRIGVPLISRRHDDVFEIAARLEYPVAAHHISAPPGIR
jgi:hypothetical protein